MTTSGTTSSATTSAPPTRRAHAWVPYVGAAAGAALLLKAALIIGSGNGVGEGPMGVLYLLGLLLGLVAAVGAGLRRRGAARRAGVAVGGVVLLVLWVIGLGEAVEPVVALVSDAQHVQDEFPVGLAGVALLALSWWGFNRDTRRPA
ncbi:MAG TPA: hypothetical protein VM433_07765 [Mycobacteriales bacterium]|nr:hypothetical protein [Mycobacteriales bacterium]